MAAARTRLVIRCVDVQVWPRERRHTAVPDVRRAAVGNKCREESGRGAEGQLKGHHAAIGASGHVHPAAAGRRPVSGQQGTAAGVWWRRTATRRRGERRRAAPESGARESRRHPRMHTRRMCGTRCTSRSRSARRRLTAHRVRRTLPHRRVRSRPHSSSAPNRNSCPSVWRGPAAKRPEIRAPLLWPSSGRRIPSLRPSRRVQRMSCLARPSHAASRREVVDRWREVEYAARIHASSRQDLQTCGASWCHRSGPRVLARSHRSTTQTSCVEKIVVPLVRAASEARVAHRLNSSALPSPRSRDDSVHAPDCRLSSARGAALAAARPVPA